MDFSVVVPVYNEERRVAEALRRIEAYMALKNWQWELLVSSDGSTDATDRIVSERAKAEPRIKLLAASPNKGKGAATRRGMLAAYGKYVLMTDVDLSSPIKESDKLIEAIAGGYDAAIGSRAIRHDGADVQQSAKRRFSGRLFNFFVRFFVTAEFRDTQCGFKCFTRDAAQKLFSEQKLDGFAFDVEILYLAKKNGLKVAEVPVMWRQGTDSKVNIFKDSFAMVGDLMKIKKMHAVLVLLFLAAAPAFGASDDTRLEAARAVSQTGSALSGVGFIDERGQVDPQWELKETPIEIIDAQDWSDEELAKLEEKEPMKSPSQR